MVVATPTPVGVRLGISRLLTRPKDPRDPEHVRGRQRAIGVFGIERAQFNGFRGATLEFLG